MTSAVAIQPTLQRPKLVPIAAARPRNRRPMSGKENVVALKQQPGSTNPISNVRSRRERPCDACRRRKSRCVIHEGALLCVLCEFHKQDCTFVESPQPRKRKLAADSPKQDEVLRKKQTADSHSNITPKSEASDAPPLTASIELSLLSKGPVPLQETLGLHPAKRSTYLGPSSPFDHTLIGLCRFNSRNETNIDFGTLKRVSDHDYFIMVPDEKIESRNEDAVALAEINDIVGPHGQTLLDLYFRIVHPNFPILHKKTFLEQIRDEHKQKEVSPSLLAGIYLLALSWWSNEPSLASEAKPDIKRLDVVAHRCLNKALLNPKLSTVQAGLIILQRPDNDSWTLTTQLVALGQELGLHLNCNSWSYPVSQWERGLMKRVAWALYMQDKWSSLIHGRPSHIFSANWAVQSIEPDDFDMIEAPDGPIDEKIEEEIAENLKGQELFAQMINLTCIMSEVMDIFYTQTAIQEFADAGSNSTRLILEKAKPVQIKLKDWYAKLPTSTRMDNFSNQKLTSTGYLHLAYYATEITLHRQIVQSLDSATSDPYLLYICRSAAKTRLISAMDFVNRLKPEHLQGFWYFASRINFTYVGTFGSLLWATAPAQEEADFYKTRLREYRWTLSVSSKMAEFLEPAVQMLDKNRSMLNHLADKPTLAQQQQQQKQQQKTQNQSRGSKAKKNRNVEVISDDGSRDTIMEDVPSLSRYTSQSNFSTFSMEGLDHFGSSENPDLISPTTPASSVGA